MSSAESRTLELPDETQFRRRRKQGVLLAAGILLVLVCVNYWPVFTGRVPLATDLITMFPPYQGLGYPALARHAELGDTITQFYPWRTSAGRSIRTGSLPLWNPGLLAGTPFQAEMQSALFYPANWLFAVIPSPAAAWTVSVMLKPLLAGFFTALFLQEVGVSLAGSLVGAFAFAFGAYMTTWGGWPQTDSSLWLPLICFFANRIHRNPTPRNAVLLSVSLAMPILAGHPGMVAHVCAAGACYGLWIVFWKVSPGRRRSLILLFSGACLGLGLAAIQLVPTVEWLGTIFRTLSLRWPSLDFSYAAALFSRDLSANPNSAGIPIPLGAAYVGALTLLAACFAWFRRDRRDTLFFFLLLFVSFCTVYGIGPIARLSQTVPLFSGIKKDEALMLVDFSLAVLAGFGISTLETFRWNEARHLTRGLYLGALLTATAGFHIATAVLSRMTKSGVALLQSPRSFRMLLVASAVLIGLRITQLIRPRLWAVLCVLIAAMDLISFSHGYMPFSRVETIFPDAPLFDFLRHQPGPFRVVSLGATVHSNFVPVYGLSSADGYDFMQKRFVSMVDNIVEPRGDAISFLAQKIIDTDGRVFDLLNIKYVITTVLNGTTNIIRERPDRFREAWSSGSVTVFENQRVLPRAFLVPLTAAEEITTEEKQLARLRQADFDPQRSVIVSAAPLFNHAGVFKTGSEKVTNYEDDTNSSRMRVQAPAPSLLVLSQIFYPGWKAYVDGKPAQLMRLDYALTGTAVDAGDHDVEFRFQPGSFLIGAIVSLSCLLFSILLWLKY